MRLAVGIPSSAFSVNMSPPSSGLIAMATWPLCAFASGARRSSSESARLMPATDAITAMATIRIMQSLLVRFQELLRRGDCIPGVGAVAQIDYPPVIGRATLLQLRQQAREVDAPLSQRQVPGDAMLVHGAVGIGQVNMGDLPVQSAEQIQLVSRAAQLRVA